MKSIYSHNLTLEIFGESHAPEIGMTLTNIPAGIKLNLDELGVFLARRAPGNSDYTSARKEIDKPEFISGFDENFVSTGEPITAVIKNQDAAPSDYDDIKNIPRPGHADYTTRIKYGDKALTTGGGHSSGRMTAPLCIAGNICMQILSAKGITIESKIDSIGDEEDEKKRIKLVEEAQKDNNSLGGIISVSVSGLEAGLGDPMFYGMENRISNIIFAIPAVKGIEFGAGFKLSSMTGFEANDEFAICGRKIITETNNCGGILGGITDGMPLTCRVAFKPTPSIARLQKSVDLEVMRPAALRIKGRHDACIVLRARPVVEAAVAIAIYDAMLEGHVVNAEKKTISNGVPNQVIPSLKNVSLDDYRAEIDKVDDELLKLFERRMDIVKKVGDYKKSHNLKISDEEREKEKLKAIKAASRKDLKKYTKSLYKEIFAISKKHQKNS